MTSANLGEEDSVGRKIYRKYVGWGFLVTVSATGLLWLLTFDTSTWRDRPSIGTSTSATTIQPVYVTAPACANGRSQIVATPAGERVSWQARVQAESLQNGVWVKLQPYANVTGEAIRFCSDSGPKEVMLTWN